MHFQGYLHFFFRFIFESIFGYTLESSFYIETFFCRSFKVRNISFRGTPCLCLLLRYLKVRMRLRPSLLDVGRFGTLVDQNCDWHTKSLYDTYIPIINSLYKYLKLKDSTFTYEKMHKATLHKELIYFKIFLPL